MTRQRYFQMEIKPDLGRSNVTLGKLSLIQLAGILVFCGFLSQKLLQKILLKLIIKDISSSDFDFFLDHRICSDMLLTIIFNSIKE